MKITVLSQLSVDKLRVLVKCDVDIVSIEFEKLISDYSLQLVDSEHEFDPTVELFLPEGKKQDKNNDDVNCLGIARALPGLQEVHATDERLWATLCLRDYREYVKSRWPVPEEPQPRPRNHILNHWFAKGVRGLMRDNAVSRLWWYHQLCSRVDDSNVEQVLEDLFFNSDYRSSMLERNGSSAITRVVRVILQITKEQARQGTLYKRDKFRNFMTDLNLLAGRTRLAVLNDEQLKRQLEAMYVRAYQ